MSKPKMFDFSKFAKDASGKVYIYKSGSTVYYFSVPLSSRSVKVGPFNDYAAAKRDAESKGKTVVPYEERYGDMATDPPVSEAQRGAMFAAKAGKSNLGIPKKVGAEFAKADPGGKLPKRA